MFSNIISKRRLVDCYESRLPCERATFDPGVEVVVNLLCYNISEFNEIPPSSKR